MKRIVATIAALSIVLAGCTRLHQPVVNLDGVDRTRYEADLAECRGEARQALADEPSVPEGLLLGAFIGALIGVGVVLLAGPPASGTSLGAVFAAFAAIGAVVGAPVGAAAAGEKAMDAVDDCLRSRGYAVGA